MALNEDKLNEFLGRFVTDLGATVAAGNVVIGHQLGLYKALAPPRPAPRSWPSAPAPTRDTSPNGSAARQRAATSSTTRPPTPTR